MREIFNRSNIFLILLMLLVFGSKANAQNDENGSGGFNWDGMNDLDNVNVGPSGGGNNDVWDYASNYWDQNPNDYIGSNNDYYNEQYSTGNSNSGNSGGGGSGGGGAPADRQTVSMVVLTQKVKPGETHTQDVKVLRDPSTSTNTKVIDLIINWRKSRYCYLLCAS